MQKASSHPLHSTPAEHAVVPSISSMAPAQIEYLKSRFDIQLFQPELEITGSIGRRPNGGGSYTL